MNRYKYLDGQKSIMPKACSECGSYESDGYVHVMPNGSVVRHEGIGVVAVDEFEDWRGYAMRVTEGHFMGIDWAARQPPDNVTRNYQNMNQYIGNVMDLHTHYNEATIPDMLEPR